MNDKPTQKIYALRHKPTGYLLTTCFQGYDDCWVLNLPGEPCGTDRIWTSGSLTGIASVLKQENGINEYFEYQPDFGSSYEGYPARPDAFDYKDIEVVKFTGNGFMPVGLNTVFAGYEDKTIPAPPVHDVPDEFK